MKIWDNKELYEEIMPRILKNVTEERDEICHIAAEKFLELLHQRIVPLVNQLNELKVREKNLIEKIEKSSRLKFFLDEDESEFGDKKSEMMSTFMKKKSKRKIVIHRVMTLQNVDDDNSNESDSYFNSRRSSFDEKMRKEAKITEEIKLQKELSKVRSEIIGAESRSKS